MGVRHARTGAPNDEPFRTVASGEFASKLIDVRGRKEPAGWAAAAVLAAVWAWTKRPRRARWTDSVAIVSGGSRGLGLLLARGLAARGARLVLVARDTRELAAAKRQLEAEGAFVETVAADLTHPDTPEQVVRAARAAFGRIDVLVNDAGIITVGPEETMSLEDYRRAMEANFWSAVRLTRAALPHLRASERAAILNITSIGGAVPVPHLAPYVASKFAFVGWSSGLAAEVAEHGIRVTTVLPWLMRTGSFLHAELKGRRPAEAANFALSSSLPFLTLSADRAAARMLRAVDRGERFVSVGALAKAARVGFSLMPGFAIAVLSVVNRLLPPAEGGAGVRQPAEPLWKHRRGIARSVLTRLGDLAARRNNELTKIRGPGATASP